MRPIEEVEEDSGGADAAGGAGELLPPRANHRPATKRESSLLKPYWSGSTDVFGVPASRHGSLNPLFQVALPPTSFCH
jgi:hypothetical protein